jgi:hypothetical protein
VLGISYHTLQAYLRAPLDLDDAGVARPKEKTKAKTDETERGRTERERTERERAGAQGAA